MNFLQKAVLVAMCLSGAAASAASIPNSYSMPNGNTGSYTYWDDAYTGLGCITCDNDSLSGGSGDLTDGIIATDNWYVAEAPAGAGPYLGWAIDPTITFHWNVGTSIDSITFYMDDSDGAGGVSAPQSITIDGTTYAVTEPAGSAPFAFTANGIGFSGTDLVVTINRKNGWVFLSEVQFFEPANDVPEPASALLLFIGLGAAAAAAGRRNKA